MIKVLVTTFCLTLLAHANAQYYIRGEVKDEKDNPLQNVKIYMHSNHLLYTTGITGGFGITTSILNDSLTFSLQGYETKSVNVKASVYQMVMLKLLSTSSNIQKRKSLSITKEVDQQVAPKWFLADESYSSLVENDFLKTDKFPGTTFSLRVDKASYSNIRRFINQNSRYHPMLLELKRC